MPSQLRILAVIGAVIAVFGQTENSFAINGACCLPDGSCQETTTFNCSMTLGGTFQGFFTSCTPNPCGPCCDECTCTVNGAGPCASGGGTFIGPTGADCSPVLCYGTACGSSANTDCTNPDTCWINGVCQANNDLGGCTSDGYPCTADFCSAGNCVHVGAAGDYCPADLNGDCVTNAADLALLLGAWSNQPTNSPADLNGDDLVNAADLAILLGSWGDCPFEWQPGDVITYPQEMWGANPAAGGPAALLFVNYISVYTSTFGVMQVGIPGAAGFSMSFTNVNSVLTYLPAGGAAGPLTSDLGNPSSSVSGVFGGQVLALRLNIDFSDAGLTLGGLGIPFGDLRMCGVTDTTAYNGMTVRQILGALNTALGGGAAPYPYSVLSGLTGNLNNAFGAGFPTTFAQDHLAIGACP